MDDLKAALKQRLDSLPSDGTPFRGPPSRRPQLVRSPSPIKVKSAAASVAEADGEANVSANAISNVTYDVDHSGDSSGDEVKYDELVEKYVQDKFKDLSLESGLAVPKLFVKVSYNLFTWEFY